MGNFTFRQKRHVTYFIILLFVGLCSKGYGQSASFGGTFVGSGDEMAIFGNHDFQNGGGAFTAGIIGTERTLPYGVISFVDGSSWINASNNGFVDGYVRKYATGAFIFPIGDNAKYRPIKIGGMTNITDLTTASYFAADPSVAITTSLAGGNHTVLPSGAPFSTVSKAANIATVNNVEYWDIDGTASTKISLSYDANSAVSSLTGGVLSKLSIVGWDVTLNQWVVIPSTIDITSFLGGNSTLTSGSITSNFPIIPGNYKAFTLASTLNSFVKINVKAYLQGAGTGVSSPILANVDGLLRDDLRSGINTGNSNLLPTSIEPYTLLGFSGVTANTVTANFSTIGNDAIVDWVLVELRSASNATAIIARQAAFIQRDGDIVDTDGISVLSIPASDASYYVSVRHRNHLGIMTASTVALSGTGTPAAIDFTLPTTVTYGTNAQITISGKNYLWAGNANLESDVNGSTVPNARVIAQGSSSDRSKILSEVINASGNSSRSNAFATAQGYLLSDTNMDGKYIANGTNADSDFVLNIVKNHPLNTSSLKIYIIKQQLP
ncbi:hypothetical protein EMA8858_03806 [Emticicia aquatica]|uniref:Uncharacterized protein n=1 Tax=Emticicia aquatica TaxID=1681835 RepID=A0ABN8EX63_9BACT|nr:hypothetical protein [Emticicia aquatica]CAH0997672.1 hypothetical protein EMA8858_03806 [Emticicia aquatica]